jgi:hypothetical protein
MDQAAAGPAPGSSTGPPSTTTASAASRSIPSSGRRRDAFSATRREAWFQEVSELLRVGLGDPGEPLADAAGDRADGDGRQVYLATPRGGDQLVEPPDKARDVDGKRSSLRAAGRRPAPATTTIVLRPGRRYPRRRSGAARPPRPSTAVSAPLSWSLPCTPPLHADPITSRSMALDDEALVGVVVYRRVSTRSGTGSAEGRRARDPNADAIHRPWIGLSLGVRELVDPAGTLDGY